MSRELLHVMQDCRKSSWADVPRTEEPPIFEYLMSGVFVNEFVWKVRIQSLPPQASDDKLQEHTVNESCDNRQC